MTDINNFSITSDMEMKLRNALGSIKPTPGDIHTDGDGRTWVILSDVPKTGRSGSPIYPSLIFETDTAGPFPAENEYWPMGKQLGYGTTGRIRIGHMDLDTGKVYDINNKVVDPDPTEYYSMSQREWNGVLKKFFRQLFPKERIAILEALGTKIPEAPLSACNMKTILTNYARNRVEYHGQYRKIIEMIDDTISNRESNIVK